MNTQMLSPHLHADGKMSEVFVVHKAFLAQNSFEAFFWTTEADGDLF